MVGDLLIIGKVYLISLGLQLAGWPVTRSIFGSLADRGWPVARLISTLVVSLTIWELASLGLPVNTSGGFWVGIVVLASVSWGWQVTKKGRPLITKEGWRMIAVEEYLFLVGLVTISLIRGFLPNLDSLEKFMDFGFINRYLNSPTLPAMDMWQAGKSINYYSFGHFWASGLVRYFQVEAAVGYNLVLGMIAGLSLSIAFGISHYLARAKEGVAGMIGGLVGALTTVLAGNSHAIWYLISHRSLEGYWYADATRFIHNTIHEFPGYSMVVADLHGHVLGLPIVLLFILILLIWLENRNIVLEMGMGVLLGVMMMTNTWDTAIYGLVLVIASLQLWAKDVKNFRPLVRSAGVMGLLMGLTALPWLMSFEPISSGLRQVTEHSPLWQLAVLWTGGLVITLIAVWVEGQGKQRLQIRTLALSIGCLILIPELIYAKDIYPDHPRANTMFKLTYQVSVMIGLLAGAVWGKLLDPERKMRRGLRYGGGVVLGLILAGSMIFPVVSFPNFYHNFDNYQGLDGEAWIQTEEPEKYGAIKYLQSNKNGKNLVEAVGDSYTKLNSLSVFSGVASIEGWRVHEWLWRGGFGEVASREAEVKEIYETDDQSKRKALLGKYNIGWIWVGEDERERYQIQDEAIKKTGEVVYQNGETYLVRVE